MEKQPVRKRRWIRFFSFVLVGTPLAIALAYWVGNARHAALRAQYGNNMKQVTLSLLNYEMATRHLPPAVETDKQGRRLTSWRFQMLCYLECFAMYIDWKSRWDDPENCVWQMPLSVYCWPYKADLPQCLHTNIVAITGPGTAFDENRLVSISDLSPSTILTIEIANSGIRWMEPGDLSIDEVPDSILRGVGGDGVHVGFADGSVWFLSANVPLDDLRKFFTIDGAKQYDREKILRPYVNVRR